MYKTLGTLFDTWPDMVCMVDRNGCFVYVNPAFTSMMGWQKEDLLGKHFNTMVHPEEQARAQLVSDKVFEGNTLTSFVTRSLKKDGTPIWTSTTSRFLPEQGVMLAVTRNVDLEVKQEQELRRSEHFFQQVIDAVEEFVLVKGPKSKVLWANKAFQNYYGMSNTELVGLIDAPFVEPDMTQQYVKDDLYVFENAKALHVPSEPVTRHDGIIRNFYTVKSPIFDEKGEVIMTVGISRDITDLEAAQAKAIESAKMATLGEMAAGIAHEINNPLAVITGRASAMRDRAMSGNLQPTTWAEECDKIEKMAMRIARIVKGLKTFSRASERDPFVLESLGAVIDDSISICQDRLNRQGVELRLKPFKRVALQCRPSQLTQVMLNLVANSIDAIENQNEKWVEIAVTERENLTELTVTDSGPTIAPEVRKQLMQPFFTTKGVGRGTGLGLSISRGIVEDHGGTLTFVDDAAHTQFRITLPKSIPNRI